MYPYRKKEEEETSQLVEDNAEYKETNCDGELRNSKTSNLHFI